MHGIQFVRPKPHVNRADVESIGRVIVILRWFSHHGSLNTRALAFDADELLDFFFYDWLVVSLGFYVIVEWDLLDNSLF